MLLRTPDSRTRVKQGGQDPGERLEVVPASADCVAGHAEERQDHADYDDDDTDRPENGDPGDEADNEERMPKIILRSS
jgi:hypothetical protein